MITIKRITTLFLLAIIGLFAQASYAATSERTCLVCAGIVSDLSSIPPMPIPLLIQTDEQNLEAVAARLATVSVELRAKTTMVVTLTADPMDQLTGVERQIEHLVTVLGPLGPLDAVGISWTGLDAKVESYAIKRLSARAQGLRISAKTLVGSGNTELIGALLDEGAGGFFDEIVALAADVPSILGLLAERDPAKRVVAIVSSADSNPLFDAAIALAAGATRAFIEETSPASAASVARLNDALIGDFAADPTADIRILDKAGVSLDNKAVVFIRGEDLRTIIIPQGDPSQWRILSLPGDDFASARRSTPTETVTVTDTGRKDGRYLAGVPPSAAPFFYTFERPKIDDPSITREAIDVVTKRGITVEEIIRNHQAYRAQQDSVAVRWVARNTTKLRFGAGGNVVEATMAGSYFSSPDGLSDWVLEELYFGGVKWKYGRFPELPIVQPEKVSQLPLDIHLTNDYRYQLVGTETLRGYNVYEVRFEPAPDAPESLPLYRGTVWIDARTWARIRVVSVELNLKGEVLSNEEQTNFVPFDRSTRQPLETAEATKLLPESMLWLPTNVTAEQVLSIAGRAFPVERTTEMTAIVLDPSDFDARHVTASASDRRILRDTDKGLRYMEKKADGTRVLKPDFDTSKVFLLGGIYHDDGIEFPVIPLGGIDYFNFNLGGRGLQTNVFFAGAIISANLTDPTFLGSRWNFGADLFSTAFAFTDTPYENGEAVDEKAISNRPSVLSARLGHPILGFGKIDLAFETAYVNAQQGADTLDGYTVPSDTFVFSPSINLRYDRAGWTGSANFQYSKRADWEPWGEPGDYSPDHQDYTRFSASLGKSFSLPRFQRIGAEVRYLDGDDLDRFSKYSFGFFGGERVRGIASGSVRAEKALVSEFSYGFVFGELIRLEVYYDHAFVDDAAAGYRREPFQGLGLAGNLIGPWGTLLRLDIAKTIGPNAQDGFVANVVFLKLFG